MRGGDGDDVLVRLDGLELARPYHLGDFDSALSFVTPAAVERAELFTGGYPAQYGDRMGGVVDLTTRTPTPRRHFSLGLSTVDAEGAMSGHLSEQASWLLTARRGSYEWPLEFKGLDEHPRYWDAFGKVALDLGTSQSLLADVLVARDQFELSSSTAGLARTTPAPGTAATPGCATPPCSTAISTPRAWSAPATWITRGSGPLDRARRPGCGARSPRFRVVLGAAGLALGGVASRRSGVGARLRAIADQARLPE